MFKTVVENRSVYYLPSIIFSTELDCENQFNCLNGACIAQSSVCDNEENCANGLDTSVSLSGKRLRLFSC